MTAPFDIVGDDQAEVGVVPMAATLPDRLKAVLHEERNQVCAECPEVGPTWACLLTNPLEESGPRLGIICCYKCYGNFFRLGKHVGEVKSTRRVRDWTEEEIEILESSGNQVVNDIYEAKLSPADKVAELEDREAFAERKYKGMVFFSKRVYQQHFKGDNNNNRLFKLPGRSLSSHAGAAFDWVSFSTHTTSKSRPAGGEELDAPTTHSKAGGLSRAFSNPFFQDSRRTELEKSRHKNQSQDSNCSRPGVKKSFSNPFALEKMRRAVSNKESNQTNLLPTLGQDQPPEEEKGGHHDDMKEEEAEVTSEHRNGRRKRISRSQRVLRKSTSNPQALEAMGQAVDDQGEGHEDIPHRSTSRRGAAFRKSLSNPTSLLNRLQSDNDDEEDEALASRSRRPVPRRGVRNTRSNPQVLQNMRQEATKRDEDATDEFRPVSTRLSSSKAVVRTTSRSSNRGVARTASNPFELAAVRQETDTSKRTSRAHPAETGKDQAVTKPKRNSNPEQRSSGDTKTGHRAMSQPKRSSTPEKSAGQDGLRRCKPSSTSDLLSVDKEDEEIEGRSQEGLRRCKPSSTTDLQNLEKEDEEKEGRRQSKDYIGLKRRKPSSATDLKKLYKKDDEEGSRKSREVNQCDERSLRKKQSSSAKRSAKGRSRSRSQSRRIEPTTEGKHGTDSLYREGSGKSLRDESSSHSVKDSSEKSLRTSRGKSQERRSARDSSVKASRKDDNRRRAKRSPRRTASEPEERKSSHKTRAHPNESAREQSKPSRRQKSSASTRRHNRDERGQRKQARRQKSSSSTRIPDEGKEREEPPKAPVRRQRSSSTRSLLRDESRLSGRSLGKEISNSAATTDRRDSDRSLSTASTFDVREENLTVPSVAVTAIENDEIMERRPSGPLIDNSGSMLSIGAAPDSPTSTVSFASDLDLFESPISPSRRSSGQSIHSTSSQQNNWFPENLSLPDLDPCGGDNEDKKTSEAPDASDQKERKSRKSRVKRTKSLNSPVRSKEDLVASEKNQLSGKQARSSRQGRRRRETCEDTIQALQAVSQTKVVVSGTTRRVALQRSLTTG